MDCFRQWTHICAEDIENSCDVEPWTTTSLSPTAEPLLATVGQAQLVRQTDWLTDRTTGWEFKGPGLWGGAKDEMLSHCQEKPFQCGNCGKKYTQRHNLDFHNLWSLGASVRCHAERNLFDSITFGLGRGRNLMSKGGHQEETL